MRLPWVGPSADPSPEDLTAVGSTLYFRASDGISHQLWKYDGSSLTEIKIGTASDPVPQDLTALGSNLYFVANDTSGLELWKYDGSNLSEIKIGTYPDSYAQDLTVVGNTLYFVAIDSTSDQLQLWNYDGSNLSEIPIGTYHEPRPQDLTAVGSNLYFTAADDTSFQLWKYDGSNLSEIKVGTYTFPSPQALTAVGSTLYFDAYDDTGYQLWKYDGSNLSEIQVGTYLSSNPTSLTAAGSNLYFIASDGFNSQLWEYDGSNLTEITINPNGDSMPSGLYAAGNTLLLSANDGIHGLEPWIVHLSTPTVPTPVVPTNAVYNGQPQGATDGDVIGDDGVDLGPPTLTYYTGTYTLANLPNSGGSSTAPTNTGDYTVVASFAGNLDYTAAYSLATYSISGVPTASVIDAGGTYNGNPFPASGTALGTDGKTTVSGSFRYTYYVGTGTSGTNLGSTAPTNAGTYTVVASFTSNDANYSNTDSAPITFTIQQAPLTVTVIALNKPYDGTTNAYLILSDNHLGNDQITESYTSANFSDPSQGNGKTVTVRGISLSGASAGNYSLQNTTATTTANIQGAGSPVTTLDAQKRLIGIVYPNGNVYERTYASDGSSTATLTNPSSGTVSSGVTSDAYAYNPAGQYTSIVVYSTNGNVFTRTYASDGDGSSRATLVSSSNRKLDDYTYDTSGKLTTLVQYPSNGNVLTLNYSNGVVSSGTLYDSNGTTLQTETFDAYGRITQIVYYSNGSPNGMVYTRTYNPDGTSQATLTNGNQTIETYNYDAQGNLISHNP